MQYKGCSVVKQSLKLKEVEMIKVHLNVLWRGSKKLGTPYLQVSSLGWGSDALVKGLLCGHVDPNFHHQGSCESRSGALCL